MDNAPAVRPMASVEVQPLASIDLVNAPKEIILPAVAAQLAALTAQIEGLKDISVDLQMSRDGIGSLRFRAYSRF